MEQETTVEPCRVCGARANLFFKDSRRFYKCPNCLLVFTNEMADPKFQETFYKGQWGAQDNMFWQKQADTLLPVITKIKGPRRILDFGSGSGALTEELRRRGYDVTPLEPMINGYLMDQSYPHRFDTVIAVEVFEHLLSLWEEIDEIEKVLTGDGIIVVSTLLTNPFIESPDSAEQFGAWWYKNDLTHVNFFCNRTIAVMAEMRDWYIDIYGNSLFVVKKQAYEG